MDSLTFTLNGGTLQTNSNISTSALFTLSSPEGTFSPAASTGLTLSGTITGNGTLMMAGNGTLTLSGNNTYSGGTTLTSGTLVVANTAGSATGTGNVTLNGGSLLGNGSISGSVIAGSGAHTINPGPSGSAGTLTVGGLSTNANTTLAFDLDSPTGTNDVLAVTGNITLSNGTLSVPSQNTLGPASLGYYKVISYAGTLTGSVSGITLPAEGTNHVLYTLDQTQDAGYIDVHRGFLGDANDDADVDLDDLNIVLNNLGTTNSSWSAGNFDGASNIDLNDLNDVLNNLGTHLNSDDTIGDDSDDDLALRNPLGKSTTQAELYHLETMIADLSDPLTPAEIAEIQAYATSVGLETPDDFTAMSASAALAPSVHPVPEPASLLLLGAATGLLALRRRR